MKNKKNIIWGTLVALFIAGLFSSCIIVDDDVELEDFRFINNYILECNYTGYITDNSIKEVRVYDRSDNDQHAEYVVVYSPSNSRITIVLEDIALKRGWCVEIDVKELIGTKTYEVTYK